jgi:hypothetical protein
VNRREVTDELQALRNERAQLRMLCNNVPVAMAYFERQGNTCRYANLGYAQTFGHDETSILGLTVAQIIGRSGGLHPAHGRQGAVAAHRHELRTPPDRCPGHGADGGSAPAAAPG